MSWVRWRLQEYTQKQKEKQQSETAQEEDEKKEEAKEIIELPPPLPVEGMIKISFSLSPS